MATSGTATFTLDFGDVAEEAFELCGLELRTGYDLRTARRSLDLLTIEWANEGVRLWTITETTQALTAADADYNLNADTIDVLDSVIRTGSGVTQQDTILTRMDATEYAQISNKLTQGTPSRIWINRQTAQPTAVLWPVPDGTETRTLVYWRLRRIQDTGGGPYNPDMPFRFLPPLTYGLAVKIAIKKAPDRLALLQGLYREAMNNATASDSDPGFQIQPMIYG